VGSGTASAGPSAAGQRWALRRWWLNRSVRTKGLIVVAVPLIALIATATVSMLLQSAERQERATARAANTLITDAGRVLTDALNGETGVRGYAATHDAVFLQPYHAALTQIAADRAAMLTAAVSQGETAGARAADASAARVFAGLADLRAAVAAGAPGPALIPELAAGRASTDTLRRQLAVLTRVPSTTLAAGKSRISSLEGTIGFFNAAGVGLGLLAGLAGVALFTTGISRRVAAVAANAERLGRGEPLQPTDQSRDDLGRLSCALAKAGELLDIRARELETRAAELTAARDQAVTATQAKNAFLSATSHELRTPLNSILGFTQLLEMSDLSDEDHDSAERILAAGRHLLALINELIDTARIESGDLSLSLEPVAIHALAEEAAQLMGPLAAERTIQITTTCTPPGLAAHVDRQRLSQVLVNLISNAVKYNRRGGAITITCHDHFPALATIVVTDTGPGIAPADLDRIFQPFERLEAAQTTIEGTGIGLPLARSLTQAMKGNLTATSTPGQGSAFTITLRRATDITGPEAGPEPEPGLATAPAAPGPARPEPVAETSLHVLYIEDNPANVDVVSRFLAHRRGTTLHTTVTGQEGIRYALAHTPDLILLDLHIPGMSGEDVLKELKAQPATAVIPIAILSAEASPSTIRRLIASGAATYLTKPLNLSELGRLLDACPGRAASAARASAPRAGITTPAAIPEAAPAPAPGPTVLYIEDDPANIRLLQRALTRRPHTQLLTAVNAHDGLRAAGAARPHLILLDNRLPDATGSQVLKELAANPATAAIPVVIISGDTGKAAADTFLASGATAFLPKPFDVGELLSTLDEHLPPPPAGA
jgi:signal transduction histidine kinase/DNA-binding response OmpR family regulator